MLQSITLTRMCCLSLPFILCFSTLSAANAKFNAFQLEGKKEMISLATNGKAEATIILPSKASPEELKAASELKKYLDLLTTADFKIVKDDTAVKGKYISVGQTIYASKAEFSAANLKLTNDGVAIKLLDGNIFLIGTETGIMNAVMAFLEEDIGCRWYSHKWEYLPYGKNLKVEVTDRVSNPDFQMRFVFTASVMSSDPVWTQHNRVMKWNLFGHVKNWFCHTYDKICPMSKFKSRPDLFAKLPSGKPFNTQLCPTHPENIETAKKQVIAALKANTNKDATFISISEYDGSTGYCHCPRCEKINKEQDAPIAAHLTLVNEVARAIAKDFPKMKVMFLSYSRDFRKPPINMKIEPNVALWFCVTGVGRCQPITDNPERKLEFAKWNKIVKNVYIWEYGCDYGNYFRVTPSLYAKTENLKFWKANSSKGVMFLEVFGAIGGDQQALRAWVLSKMLWNTSLNADELARDFCEGVFGIAADDMYEYYKLIDTAGRAGKSVEDFYGKQKFISQANAIFDKAIAKANADKNEKLRNRIEVHYIPIALMEIDDIFDAYPKNRTNFPTKRYAQLLSQIKTITTREDMAKYSELRTMAGRLNELELLAGASKDGSLRIHSVNGTLYQYPLKKDPLATNGMATRLPCNDDWLVQWHFPVNLCIPDRKYQLRAQLREEKDIETGHVATIGVHVKDNPNASFTDQIQGEQICSKEYRWINIGEPFVPQKNSYIWFSATADCGIGGLFVNEIELAPCPE